MTNYIWACGDVIHLCTLHTFSIYSAKLDKHRHPSSRPTFTDEIITFAAHFLLYDFVGKYPEQNEKIFDSFYTWFFENKSLFGLSGYKKYIELICAGHRGKYNLFLHDLY